MKKSMRPKARPDGLKMMPGDEMSSNRAAVPDAIEPKRSVRPKARPKYMEDDAAAVERGRRSYEREMEDMPEKKYAGGGMVQYAGGGMVRGCKSSQFSGKRFTGTF